MTYILLFVEFFKVGLFTFGGGFAMIPLIKEVVLNAFAIKLATIQKINSL